MKHRLLKTLTAFALIVMMVATLVPALSLGISAADTYTWTRVTSVDTLTAGGEFIIGYEATANSGVIIPMANTGSATTSAAGFMYSGSAAASGDKTTLNMTEYSDDGAAFVVTIAESTVTPGNITIKTANGYIGNANTKNNCKLFAEDSTGNGTSFTPTVGDNDVFTLKSANKTYHTLQYNSSSPRFACYGGTQKNLVVYKREVASAPHEHDYAWNNVEGVDGTHTLTCSDTDGKCDVLTVTEDCSWVDGYCSVCNAKAPDCAHPTTEEVAEIAPTCTEVGYTAGVKCTVCNQYTSGHEEIDALGHTEVTDAAVAATCTTTGLTEGAHCSVCEEVFTAQTETPALGHNYVDGECTVCQDKVDQYALITNATELVNGAKIIIAAPSKNVALGAQNGTYRSNVSATITNNMINGIPSGAVVVELIASGDNWLLKVGENNYLSLTSSSNALNTSTVTDVSNPDDSLLWSITIEDNNAVIKSVAYTTRTIRYNSSSPRFACYTSGQTAISIFKFVCQHTNTTAIGENKDPTCTESGSVAGVQCVDCQKIITPETEIDALGHKDENPVDSKCDTCGSNLCTEHIWVDGAVTKDPTCTDTGLQEQYCENCQQPGEDKILDKVAHTPVTDAAVAATCIATGLTEGSHCSVCGEILVAQEVVATVAHNYVDGACSVCGDIVVSGSQLAEFQFGENGDASHKDGNSAISAGTVETSGNYELTLTSPTRVYDGAFDAKGNSALKLGTGSKDASFSFTVADNVNTVVFYIAGYKADTAKLNINGTEYEITSKSDEGNYTKIVVDTSTTKTVTLTTLSGGYRAMIDSIEFWGEPAPELTGFGASLNKGVTIKVTYTITEAWLASNPDAKIVFSNGIELDAVAGTNVYTVDLAPADIASALTVTVNGVKKNVSLSDYAELLAKYTADELGYTQQKYDALMALVEAVLTYSNAVKGNVTVTAAEGFDSLTAVGTFENSVNDGTIISVGAHLGQYASLTLNKTLGAAVDVTLGGRTIATDYTGAGLTAEGIYPNDFDSEIVITNDGTLNYIITFNSYLKSVYDTTQDTYTKNLAAATYNYGVATEAYLLVK